MPAVRSASGPIKVPSCEAPISMGTPSRAMLGRLARSDMRRGLRRIVGWAKRSVPTDKDHQLEDGGHGASAPLPTLHRYALK